MSQQKEIISTINGLIETLKDGQQGFKEASEAVKDSALKSLFSEFSLQRAKFAGELQNEAVSLGESNPEDSSSTAGAMHRAWINLKSAITSQDDHAILAECERGEDSAVAEYKKAMEEEELSSPIRETISRQYTDVKSAHDRIKALRDASRRPCFLSSGTASLCEAQSLATVSAVLARRPHSAAATCDTFAP
jgi:uncharacterized protein (TIGR02284 family)